MLLRDFRGRDKDMKTGETAMTVTTVSNALLNRSPDMCDL